MKVSRVMPASPVFSLKHNYMINESGNNIIADFPIGFRPGREKDSLLTLTKRMWLSEVSYTFQMNLAKLNSDTVIETN